MPSSPSPAGSSPTSASADGACAPVTDAAVSPAAVAVLRDLARALDTDAVDTGDDVTQGRVDAALVALLDRLAVLLDQADTGLDVDPGA